MRELSFRRNLLANYFGQAYVTLIGIVMLPMFIRYMGAEAYGLVGFFTMLQIWFQLLDLGLTPTIARQTACFNGGAIDALSLRRLLRTLEGIFIAIAVVGAAAIAASADAITNQWLNVQQLSPAEVRHAIILMAAIIALRWTSGIYRGAINGFERLVWLNSLNAAIATARFVLVIPVFILVGATPTEFFGFQLAVAAIELAMLVWKTYRLLPPVEKTALVAWEWRSLRGVLKFSMAIAFTSSVWVITTQLDKLVLSKMLPLADYAYFTLAVLVANGIMLITGPVSLALMPRLTSLSAKGDEAGMIRLYRSSTQMVAVIAVPVSMILALFSEQVLWAWTGDATVAAKAAPILTLYALGYGFLAIAAFPYYLQFAKGDLKLHLIGNALFITALVPALILATSRYGALGAGYVWLCSNAVYFFCWVPLVHRRFAKGLHAKWLAQDVGIIVLLTVAGAALAHSLVSWPQDRIPTALEITAIGLGVLLAAAAGSSELRTMIGDKKYQWREKPG